MSKSINNLKYFLKEMFQFNENDLDFGIYKIYNLKRKNIEGFIDGDNTNDLAPTIEGILKEVNLENQKNDALDLYNFLKGINKELLLKEPEKNYDRIKGQLELDLDDENEKSKLIDTLNNLKKSEGITDELKDKIYNHILGFFQMYYSNGDFGYNDRSRDLYKVPYEADYNGSDTMFHWKHKGSLYIKTGTSFNAIKFELNGKKIEYRLETNENSEEEGTSQNNNKDSQLKHYRFDRIEKVKDKASNEDVYQVIFNLSDASTSKVDIYKAIFKEIFKETDIDKYLEYTKADKTKQVFVDLTKDFDKVQNGAIKGLSALRQKKLKIEKEVKNNFDRGVRLYDKETKQFTDETLKALYTLDQKLNSFYIGNDADYFIHENLNEFLTNEKNRYVKNYIFDDLESIYAGKLDNTTLIVAKAFDKVSSRIIEFLSAIEDFQKHLFTKKKKVVESEYCITVDYIDEQYYPEILANKIQLQEWENLFSLEVKTIEDIKANPTLVLDTKCFKKPDGTNQFKNKILAEIDDLDDKINGLLINSENYQAIKGLSTKYKSKINTIYIDPPYNAKSSQIIYKNNFKHSSWASFMENRIEKSKSLLNPKGIFIVAIDENEQERLGQILSKQFPQYEKSCISVIHNPGGIQGSNFSYTNEFAYFMFPNDGNYIKRVKRDESNIESLRDWGGDDSKRESAKNCFYPIFVDNDNNIKGFGEVCSDDFNPDSQNIIIDSDTIAVYPIDDNGVERKWRYARQSVEDILEQLICKEKGGVKYIQNEKSYFRLKTVWDDKKYNANVYGSKVLNNIVGPKKFDFPKSVFTVRDSIYSTTENDSYILDYFAGSGTTGHSVLMLNKEDEKSKRKYILIEMGKYFDLVTKARTQKIIYSENWSDSKPLDKDGSPKHIFKYQVLEQYEDVLDNLRVYEGELPENLPIKYLYKPEENSLDTTLNLFTPFSNTISYGQPTQQGFIDIVETYNYLQGYFIKSIKTYELNKKYYKVIETTNGELVVWRDITINEDDSKQVIEITSKYTNIHTIEVNAEFATLNLDKSNNLKVEDTDIELKIISKELFNQ
jgi:adenine-specific DNA-methyltransferase